MLRPAACLRTLHLQSATIAQQLEITHASLQDVTEQLHALQQQIQQERAQHNQQLARTTAEADHGMQQLQQRHEQQVQQLQEEQKHQLTRKNSVEHRLDTELAEAKAQLAAVMHDLAAERHTSGRLHEQVAKLHHEFEDARKRHSLSVLILLHMWSQEPGNTATLIEVKLRKSL